jgi:starvation-inducible DNA-binding protein
MTYSDSFAMTQFQPTVSTESEPVIELQPDQEGASVAGLVERLIDYASYLHQLYTQAHLVHLNIEGPLFFPIHAFLKDQYDAHVTQFDSTCEFVRSLDYLVPLCQRSLLAAHKGFKHVKDFDTRNMLTTYLRNVEDAGLKAKELGQYANEVEAPDVENFLADTVGAMYKAAWMIKATLHSK